MANMKSGNERLTMLHLFGSLVINDSFNIHSTHG
jgi:hypothetical protein